MLTGIVALFALVGMMLGVAFFVFVIYALALFVRFANKGIQAFDIYIKDKTQND